MKIIFNSKRTRWTATVMVLVWTMTMAVGLANACVIHQGEAVHDHSIAVSLAVIDQHEAGEERISLAALACQSFCASAESTLVKDKVQFDAPQAQALDLA